MPVPTYDHIVIVMMENHNFSSIIGNTTDAPYINYLASAGALLTNYVAVAHPSQPNYFALYAGSTFGVTDDDHHTESGPTLATILQGAGKTFAGYVEHQGTSFDHNPWESFPEGTTVERDFKTFSTGNYANLPTVSFVIPNVYNDMHNGTIAQGDAWVKANLDSYAKWALAHNSLLIVQWDENETGSPNLVPSIFFGAHVTPGPDGESVNNYNILSTILASYGLVGPNNAATASTINVFGGTTISSPTSGQLTLTPANNPLLITSAGKVTSTGSSAGIVGGSSTTWNITNVGTVISSGSYGISLNGLGYITNSGAISGVDGIGMHAGGSISNQPGGTISATGMSGTGIFATGFTVTVSNSGTISGVNHNAILLTAGGSVTNNVGGSITARDTGVFITGGTGAVMNSGAITATAGTGVDFEAGGSITNNASGSITGDSFGVFVGGGLGALDNFGTISAGSTDGVLFAAGGTLINESGASITGGSNAVYFKSGATSSVTNAGTITANGGAAVDLAGGGSMSNGSTGIAKGTDFGVFINGSTGTVTNSGRIEATRYDGVALERGGSITNAAGATIIGGSNAVYISTGREGQ